MQILKLILTILIILFIGTILLFFICAGILNQRIRCEIEENEKEELNK